VSVIAIQGERGAFSHAAARQVVGGDPDILACRTFEELFAAVESNKSELGMVPVENTLAGSVQRNLDLLVHHTLHAVAETRVRIDLCLVAPPGRSLAEIRSAASHPVALQQCHTFFREHPGVAPVVAYDTAGSVRDLLDGRGDYDAAIGSVLAAELYGGEVLLDHIEDDAGNFTRFLAVAREPTPVVGEAKTSIAFTVPHRPGSLHEALGRFARRGVDLTRLESRPIAGTPWEYRFYADLRGVPLAEQLACVEELRGAGSDVRVLGSYAEAGVG
jgi:prephenate dehydratase